MWRAELNGEGAPLLKVRLRAGCERSFPSSELPRKRFRSLRARFEALRNSPQSWRPESQGFLEFHDGYQDQEPMELLARRSAANA